MSEKAEEALRLHGEGCNCCQAVVAALAGEEGLSREDAMRVGAAFGGGMRRGEVCGAVVGALMVLGLRHGARQPGDQEAKAASGGKTADYMKAFAERHGSYLCRDLIKAAGKKICREVIPGAVTLLEEMDG